MNLSLNSEKEYLMKPWIQIPNEPCSIAFLHSNCELLTRNDDVLHCPDCPFDFFFFSCDHTHIWTKNSKGKRLGKQFVSTLHVIIFVANLLMKFLFECINTYIRWIYRQCVCEYSHFLQSAICTQSFSLVGQFTRKCPFAFIYIKLLK